MAFESLSTADEHAHTTAHEPEERLSQHGQMIGWAVYGSLVVIGFVFGVVTGYERPKTIVVAKATKEKETTRTETPRPAPRQPVTLETPVTTPPTTPPAATPPATPPMPEKPVEMPPKKDPPAVTSPKKDPPAVTPPKKDPVTPPKTENIKAVHFKEVVASVFRSYCLDCHGGSSGKPKGGVDLTSIAKIKSSKASNGDLLTPGKPEESRIYVSITEMSMPPDGKKGPTPAELMVLKNWILTGAKERRSIRRRPGRHRLG
jgi:hypothetical protein